MKSNIICSRLHGLLVLISEYDSLAVPGGVVVWRCNRHGWPTSPIGMDQRGVQPSPFHHQRSHVVCLGDICSRLPRTSAGCDVIRQSTPHVLRHPIDLHLLTAAMAVGRQLRDDCSDHAVNVGSIFGQWASVSFSSAGKNISCLHYPTVYHFKMVAVLWSWNHLPNLFLRYLEQITEL